MVYNIYESNDPVLTDRDSINNKVYLDGQNVRPSFKRLKKSFLSFVYHG